MKREYSVAESNIYAKEVVKIINGNNARRFAVVMPVDSSGNLKQYPTLSPMTLLSTDLVDRTAKNNKGEVVMSLSGALSTYETVINGEKFKIKLPVLPSLPPDELLDLGADVIEYAEAVRTMVLQALMTLPPYRVLDSESVSIVLADRLLESAGMSLKIENLIKSRYGKNSPEARKEMDQYANSKVVAPMIDKTINITLDMFVKQFRKHAEAIRKHAKSVTTAKVAENGIVPVSTPSRKENIVKVANGMPEQSKLDDILFGGFEDR